ncbi:MAG: hypothetical protein AAF514_20815, partial [Verrucomicrobiota bacterium]
ESRSFHPTISGRVGFETLLGASGQQVLQFKFLILTDHATVVKIPYRLPIPTEEPGKVVNIDKRRNTAELLAPFPSGLLACLVGIGKDSDVTAFSRF